MILAVAGMLSSEKLGARETGHETPASAAYSWEAG